MIYFLDNDLQLQKIVTSKNIISAIHEHELNGLIRGDIELDLSYAKFLVLGIDYVGYYYKDEYYLHKIQRVEHDHVNETAKIVLRHIFFEDMLFGKMIRDVRPQNQEAGYMLRQTIDTNTRWQTNLIDTTGRLSTNFYWQVPYEVIEWVTENFRVEYVPKILFDGQKINDFQLQVAKRIGQDKNIRIPFGSRVLDLKYEVDYSEIITKLVGHGKGEEVGDGYGRRIDFGDVDFSRNGVESPKGSLFMEDETVTATYGNDGQTPREGRVVFEDIENKTELANATYEHYLQVSRPQMLFTADVAKIGDVGIGDSVLIIRREHDVYFKARIHKLTVDLLYPEDAQVELGDYEHFKESKVERRNKQSNKLIKKHGSEIQRLKNEFDERFNAEVAQFRAEFDQAKIDILAEVEADRVRMEVEFNKALTDWTDAFNADVEQAYKDAEKNYARIEQEINTAVDTTRNELEQGYTDAVEQAKRYAEEQSKAHADVVESKLEDVTGTHQNLIESLQNDVTDIDAFLGNRTEPLEQTLQNMKLEWEQKLDNVDTWHYNMLRETKTLDDEYWEAVRGTLETDGNGDRYYKAEEEEAYQRVLRSREPMTFNSGETYILSFDVQTYAHRSMDYIYIINRDDNDDSGNLWIAGSIVKKQTADVIHWGSEYRRYYVEFVLPRDIFGVIQIGGNFRNNNLGAKKYRIKKPYLTQSNNIRWMFHLEDSTQNLEEISRRVMQLEDGYEEFVTRTEYDFDTGELDGRIKHVTSTVDGFEQTISNHENWILTNGASIEHTVDGFESKAWLSDIDNPNLIPHASVHIGNHRLMWDRGLASATGQSYQDWMQVTHATSPRSYLAVYSPEFSTVAGETYTFTFESWENGSDSSNTTGNMGYTFLTYRDSTNQSIWSSFKRKKIGTINGADIYGNEVTFTANATSDTARLLIGTRVVNIGQHSTFRFRNPKLEVGSRATLFNNAFTGITQRADELFLMYQGLGEEGFVTQSQIKLDGKGVQIGSTYVDGSAIGSILAVSPSGIDAVAKQMRLSGDLLVEGDVTALAVEAIEGRFSNLFTSHLTANIIKGTHIDSKTITSDHIVVNDALVNLIVARRVFADDITSKIGNFIDINAGRVRTAILESNVITADHLAVGTIMVDKIFGTSGRIDQLITKDHFVQNIKALSIEAVDAQFSNLLTKYMKAGYIDVDWINGLNAWFERMYVNNAMISKLTSQTAFVRDIRAISIEAYELNLTTLMNSMGQVEGGISIRRIDGVYSIINGLERFGHPVTFVQQVDGNGAGDVLVTQNYWETNARGAQQVGGMYAEHAGRWLNIVVGVGLRADADHASSYMKVFIRPSNIPSGASGEGWAKTHEEQFFVRRGETTYHTINVPLGRPTYGACSWTLEFARVGDNNRNPVQLRRRRIWISA